MADNSHTIQCAECRCTHALPRDGPAGFPTNRYILEMLDMMRRTTRQNQASRQHIQDIDEAGAHTSVCNIHQKPHAMFCSDFYCRKLLCPACPVSQHTGHSLVSLSENIRNSDKLRYIKEDLHREQGRHQEFSAVVDRCIRDVDRRKNEAHRAVDKKLDEIKRQGERLKQKIQQASDEERKRLQKLQTNVNKCFQNGKELENKLEKLSGNTTSTCLQPFTPFLEHCSQQKHFLREVGPKTTAYRIVKFRDTSCHNSVHFGEMRTKSIDMPFQVKRT